MKTVPLCEDSWNGYELLASGDGKRLERWNGRVILRPESLADWPWKDRGALPAFDGRYSGTHATGGTWTWIHHLPDPSTVSFDHLTFFVRPTNSKHLGLFPEQSENWNWIRTMLGAVSCRNEPVKVLNLFGYTGGGTLAAASSGASVTHVDSARAMVSWCAENARLSGLGDAPIRYIVEDAITFLQREIRRGNRYDAVIMDPPAFGRGKKGELWKLTEHLPFLIDTVQEALNEHPLFLLLNTYSECLDELAESMILRRLSRLGGFTDIARLGLTGTIDNTWLPCGAAYRWQGK